MKSPSSTYYYHYDVHGNTLKVTDTNQDTKITYTYDTLGNITSQTNPDSIPNPFTFMGASQTILDTETNLYFSSGYYNPQTGTLLQGTGSPAMPNPTSISTINSMSTSSLPEAQLLSHSITSATTAGSSSGGEPGSFAPTESDGLQQAGNQNPPPDGMDGGNTEANARITQDLPPHLPDMTKWAIGAPRKGSRDRMITGDVWDVISPGGVPAPNAIPLTGGAKCLRCGQEHLTIVCPCDGSDTARCIINAESSAASLQTDDLKQNPPESGVSSSTDNKVSEKLNSSNDRKSESGINGLGDVIPFFPEEVSVFAFCVKAFLKDWSLGNMLTILLGSLISPAGNVIFTEMYLRTADLAQEFLKEYTVDLVKVQYHYGSELGGLSAASILHCLLFEAAIAFGNDRGDPLAYKKYPEEFKMFFLKRHCKNDFNGTGIIAKKEKKKGEKGVGKKDISDLIGLFPPVTILPAPKYPFEWSTK